MRTRFPVLWNRSAEELRFNTPIPRSVSMEMIAPWEEQAQFNHSQSLETLVNRGGLSPLEIWCLVRGVRYQQRGDMTEAKAILWLKQIDHVEWDPPLD